VLKARRIVVSALLLGIVMLFGSGPAIADDSHWLTASAAVNLSLDDSHW
jgi:hypothetical protein